MNNVISKSIVDHDVIILHRHVRPDPDALGSQCGLAEIIRTSFPEKKVFTVGEDDPSLTYLATMDDIGDAKYDGALIIVCDTANQERISDERFKLGKTIIKIDHHPNVDQYGDYQWVNTDASSTSEMIYEWFLGAKKDGFILNTNAARLLYAGIVGDTGRFLFPSTTNKTLRYAADLVQYPFDRALLHEGIYNTSPDIARLKGYILQNFSVSHVGVCSVKLTKGILEKFKVSPTESSQMIGILGDIEGILSWVFFVEEDDVIRVRLRSKGPVINQVATKYNGGGHPLASGAVIYHWDEVEKVVEDLEKVCKEYTDSLYKEHT
ncbi:bifunctional oligoribonuclease/PAP phosphatase NrnA [Bacillaceae bacterium S4-13-56]